MIHTPAATDMAALREVGRIERTLFALRWFEDAGLRRTVTAEFPELDSGAVFGS